MPADRGNQAVAFLRVGYNGLWIACIVAEGLSQLGNAALQGAGFDDRIGPDGIHQGFLADYLALMSGKML